MKHIKEIENVDLKYKADDYVYIHADNRSVIDKYGIIKFENEKGYDRRWDYLVLAYNTYNHKFEHFYVNEYDILRKLYKHEIDEFVVKISAEKYNL